MNKTDICKGTNNNSAVFFIGLLAIYALYFFVITKAYNHGTTLFGEGGVLSAANRILSGDILYKDISVPYAPGEYYLLAGLFGIFGKSVVIERLMWLVAKLIGLIFVYLVSKKIMRPFYAFLSGILYIFMGGVLHKVFYTSITLAVLFVLFIFLERGGRKWLVLAGALAGLNIIFRQDTGVFSLVFGIAAIFLKNHADGTRNFKTASADTLALFLPFFALVLPVGVYFYLNNAIGDMYYWCFKFAVSTEVDMGEPFPSLIPGSSGHGTFFNALHFYLSRQFLYYIPLFILFGVAVILANRYFKREWTIKDSYVFLLFMFGTSLLTKEILVPRYEHFVQAALPEYILGCYLLSGMDAKVRGFANIKKWQKATSTVFLSLIPLFFAWHDSMFCTRYNPYITGKNVRILNIDVAPVYVNDEEGKQIEGVVNYIKSNTKAGDAIFSTTLPMFYFLTNRRNPTQYDSMFPGYIKSEADERKLVNTVSREAKYIIYFNFRITRRRAWEFKDYAPLMDRFLKKQCVQVAQFGPYKIFKPMRRI